MTRCNYHTPTAYSPGWWSAITTSPVRSLSSLSTLTVACPLTVTTHYSRFMRHFGYNQNTCYCIPIVDIIIKLMLSRYPLYLYYELFKVCDKQIYDYAAFNVMYFFLGW